MEVQTDLLERAMTTTGQLIRKVRPDQLGDPTPCTDWTVAVLINHAVAGNRFFETLARDGKADWSIWKRDHLGDSDPGTAYEQAARSALEAWATPGAGELAVPLPGGGPKAFDMHLVDTLLHGWDLATATGQDRSGDPAVVEALSARWDELQPLVRKLGPAFAPEVPCPDDAAPLDRLAASLGRTP